jgi:hypothetical protein
MRQVLGKLKLPFFLVLFTLFFWCWLPLTPTDTSEGFMLIKPVLAESTDTTFLEEEVGIAIYTHINQSLDLFKAKSAFKTVEKETSNYVIGSVSLPSLPETDDVHSYIQKDGWIVVYYLTNEPVSKVIDWNYYSEGKLTKTKLQIGLEEIRSALGITATDAKYYHFQYPPANRLMVIIESHQGVGTDSFNLKIPSEFIFYERSWSHRAGEGTVTKYGLLTDAQLSSDTFHTIEAIGSYSGGYYSSSNSYLKVNGETISHISGSTTSEAGIVLIYREP